jgi:hypothetical protein
MKSILMATSLIGLLITGPNDSITGRWQSRPSAKGNVTSTVFKEDGKLEGFINKKPFVSGVYFYSAADSILTFTDNGCGGSTGVYKVNFFSSGDSLRFTAIYDSCMGRKAGMQRLIMGRGSDIQNR